MKIVSLSLVLMSTSFSIHAQTAEPPVPPQPPEITMPGVAASDIQVISHSFGMAGGKPVVDAPYSAEQTTEHVQTLTDGNRIVNTTVSHLYRDSQGRMRVEVNLPGSDAASGETRKSITITDVVAGASYNLQTETSTAYKMPMPKLVLAEPVSPGSAPTTMPVPPIPALPPLPPEGSGPVLITMAMPAPARSDTKREDLGTQVVNGVNAKGTRTTTLIPAGAVGNQMPIEITRESWYSPELKIVVKSTSNDPRVGQTTVSLTNVSRSTPDPSLFQVPAGYTISDRGPNILFRRTTATKAPGQ